MTDKIPTPAINPLEELRGLVRAQQARVEKCRSQPGAGRVARRQLQSEESLLAYLLAQLAKLEEKAASLASTATAPEGSFVWTEKDEAFYLRFLAECHEDEAPRQRAPRERKPGSDPQ